MFKYLKKIILCIVILIISISFVYADSSNKNIANSFKINGST